MRFRKKPVVIEAVQVKAADYNGSTFDGAPFSDMPPWLALAIESGQIRSDTPRHTDYAEWAIPTLEGTMWASPGDWIIQGVQGELYPCKPDIFAATYEPAESAPDTPEAA